MKPILFLLAIIFVITLSFISFAQEENDFDIAYSYYKDGDYSQALIYYEKALGIEPERQGIWLEYTSCLRKLKRYQMAAQAGWRTLELGKDSPDGWGNLGNVFLDTHTWDEALNAYKIAQQNTDDKKWAIQNFLNLGYEQWRCNLLEDAAKTLAYAYNLDSNHAPTIVDIGVLYASSNQVDLGKQEIQKALIILEKEDNENA